MKQIIKITSLLAIAMSVAFTTNITAGFSAEALPNAVIAVIDSRQVRFNSAAGKDIQAQLDTIRQKFQTEIAEKEVTLKEEEATLKSQRAILPKDSYEAKVREFQNKVLEVQREVQAKNKQLEAALVSAQNKVQRALKPILQKVLKDHKATMIMDISLVIEKAAGLDVTTRVIEQLDLALPTVKVEMPALAPQQ